VLRHRRQCQRLRWSPRLSRLRSPNRSRILQRNAQPLRGRKFIVPARITVDGWNRFTPGMVSNAKLNATPSGSARRSLARSAAHCARRASGDIAARSRVPKVNSIFQSAKQCFRNLQPCVQLRSVALRSVVGRSRLIGDPKSGGGKCGGDIHTHATSARRRRYQLR
jgi:hypothetical protein